MHPLQATGIATRLSPPATLTTDELSLFTDVVNSVEPRHFTRSDLPLIVSFCQVTAACRAHAAKATADPCKDTISAWASC